MKRKDHSDGACSATLISGSKDDQEVLATKQQSSLSSKVPLAGFSAINNASSSAGASASNNSGVLSRRQSLALRNNNAQNIPLDASTGNMDPPASGSSAVKRKYAPSLLERLHSRADLENIHLSPTQSLSVYPASYNTTSYSVERQVDVAAREEAERAEAAKRAERAAFEEWRDAKIAEKRAKKAR